MRAKGNSYPSPARYQFLMIRLEDPRRSFHEHHDILGLSEAIRAQMDYYAHSRNSDELITKLAAALK